MVVITVSGGKGGTGKTLVAASLARSFSLSARTLLVDLDADNPCTYTLLGVDPVILREVRAFTPVIDVDNCVRCGECTHHCPAGALVLVPNKLIFVETLCEGCGACLYVCKHGAISEGSRTLGWVKRASVKNLDLLIAEARAGERKTDDVAIEVLDEAMEAKPQYSWIVIDTPAGTGRLVKLAINEADLVLLVTEPTRLGLYDLKRAIKLVDVGKPVLVVINKYDMPGGILAEVEGFLRNVGVEWVYVPMDIHVQGAYVKGLSYLEEVSKPVARALSEVSARVKELLARTGKRL